MLVGKQRGGQLGDRLMRSTLTHPNQHGFVANRHHVAAFERGSTVVYGWIPPPDVNIGFAKVWVELIDRRGQNGLFVTGRPIQWVQGHAAVDPAGGITGI
ncbi:hypothetical protein D3C76_1503860 [compost metagenome]